jgi:hypothetical protein
MLVTERPGRMRIVDANGRLSEPLAGVPEVFARGEGGLLDVALHPGFADNRRVYLAYAEPGSGGTAGTAVARGRLRDDGLADAEVIYRPSTGRAAATRSTVPRPARTTAGRSSGYDVHYSGEKVGVGTAKPHRQAGHGAARLLLGSGDRAVGHVVLHRRGFSGLEGKHPHRLAPARAPRAPDALEDDRVTGPRGSRRAHPGRPARAGWIALLA